MLERVRKKAAQFRNHMKDWETLDQRRTVTCSCALFMAYTGERSWKATRDRLQRTYCLSRVDHVRKIRDRKQRTDIGKYFFVNSTIRNWKQTPGRALGLSSLNLRVLETELGKQL